MRIWGRNATSLARSFSGSFKKSISFIHMFPAVTLALELRHDKRVVFPHPLGPTIVVIFQSLKSILISSNICVPETETLTCL